jgi:hypothetical protein
VIALVTFGTTTYVIEKSHEGTAKESGNPRNLNVASQDMPANDQSGKARARAGEFQSLEEAEQALLVFDLTPMIPPSAATSGSPMASAPGTRWTPLPLPNGGSSEALNDSNRKDRQSPMPD